MKILITLALLLPLMTTIGSSTAQAAMFCGKKVVVVIQKRTPRRSLVRIGITEKVELLYTQGAAKCHSYGKVKVGSSSTRSLKKGKRTLARLGKRSVTVTWIIQGYPKPYTMLVN